MKLYRIENSTQCHVIEVNTFMTGPQIKIIGEGEVKFECDSSSSFNILWSTWPKFCEGCIPIVRLHAVRIIRPK